jgi:hypothetical protein
MSHRYAASRSSIYLTALALFLLSGCASMTSSKEELQSLRENEGIVIGSVLLTAAKGDTEESGWAFLRGRKAGELEYSVSISETGFNPLKTTYSVPAIPGKEEVFIKKLPVGSYNMNELKPSGLLAPQLRLSLDIHFSVKPRQTSYIGKLVVSFPDRITAGSPVRVEIMDAQVETVERLRGEHPSIVPNTVKELATTRTFR